MMSLVLVGMRVLAALPLLALLAVWLIADVPLIAKAAPLLLMAIAAWRLPVALIVLAALAPVAMLLSSWTSVPFQGPRLFEQLAIAVSIAAIVRGLSWTTSRIATPALLFVALVVISAVVTMPSWFLMHGTIPTLDAFAGSLRQGDLFAVIPAWHPVTAAVLIVVGVVLAITFEHVVRTVPQTRDHVVLALVGGGTVAALFNLRRVLELAGERGQLDPSGLLHLLGTLRLNTQFDVNAAGSMFALIVLAGAGLLYRTGWVRWVVAAGLLTMTVGGIWLTGSRTAMAATIVATLAAMGALALRARPEHRRRALLALAGGVVLAAAAVAVYPSSRNFAVSSSVESRLILYRTAIHMWREAPVAGVGIGTFWTRSISYGSAEIDKILVTGRLRENAHNYFLQVLAELGVVGLTLFVAVLVAGLWSSGSAVWLAAGVGAFLATSLTGHPQLLSEAVLPFWIVFGCVASAGPALSSSWSRVRASAVAISVIGMASAVPFLSGRARDLASLEHGGTGVSAWQHSDDGLRYRTADDDSVVFVPTGHTIVAPVRLAPGTAETAVDVWVDGVVVNRLVLRSDEWTDLRLSIRNARRKFVDLQLRGAPGVTFLIGKVDAKILD